MVTPALVGEWLSYWQPDLPFSVMIRASGLLFIGYVVLEFLRFNVHAPRVDFGVLCAAIATYLMVEAVFGMFYVTLLIARLVSLYSLKGPLEAVNSEEIASNKSIGLGNSQTSSCRKRQA